MFTLGRAEIFKDTRCIFALDPGLAAGRVGSISHPVRIFQDES
jgi:hypothetical protein